VQDAASQRDGWDELDTSMLEGLDLGNPASVPGHETPQAQSGSETGVRVEAPPSTQPDPEVASVSSRASTQDESSRQARPTGKVLPFSPTARSLLESGDSAGPKVGFECFWGAARLGCCDVCVYLQIISKVDHL